MRNSALLLVTLLTVGCEEKKGWKSLSEWGPQEVNGKNVLVLVPGLYGSTLSDEQGKRVFETFTQGLWGSTPMAIHDVDLKIPRATALRADGILEGVDIIPGIYSVDAYGKSLRYFQKKYGDHAIVIAFHYDWRRDISIPVKALDELLQSLRKSGAKSISLVGHSLGALISSYYLRYGGQSVDLAVEDWRGCDIVDSAILAAPAYRGAMSAFKDFARGTALGPSKKQLDATTIGSLITFYQFLPQADPTLYLDETGKPLDQQILELSNWRKWKLGLFHSTEGLTKETLDERETFTGHGLTQGQRFHQLMNAPAKRSPKRRIPALLVIGTGTPTLARAVHASEWIFDDKSLGYLASPPLKSLYDDGDNLITVASATPPEAFAKELDLEQVSLPIPHRAMFAEPSLQERMEKFLQKHNF